MSRIEEIKERLKKITPGQWWQGGKIPGWGSLYSVLVETEMGYKSVASTGGHSDNKADSAQLRNWQVADADFIAHAASDMQALLAEIERLWEVIEGVQEYLNGLACEDSEACGDCWCNTLRELRKKAGRGV